MDFSRSPGYLLAKISGQWTTRNAEDAVDRIRQEAELRQERKILMDLMDFSAPDSEMTRYYTGEKIAEAFPFPFKVAGYSQSEKINRFTETVAVNRSAHFRVFDSREAAIDWLTRSGK